MDRVKDGAMNEFLEIFRRDEGEKEAGDAGSRVESLPRTNAEFQSCALRATLCDQLEAQLGALVDEVLISDELEFRCVDGVRPEAIDKAVARRSKRQLLQVLLMMQATALLLSVQPGAFSVEPWTTFATLTWNEKVRTSRRRPRAGTIGWASST